MRTPSFRWLMGQEGFPVPPVTEPIKVSLLVMRCIQCTAMIQSYAAVVFNVLSIDSRMAGPKWIQIKDVLNAQLFMLFF